MLMTFNVKMALQQLLASFLIILAPQLSQVAPKSFHKLEDITSNKLLSGYYDHHNISNLYILSPAKSTLKRLSHYGESCTSQDDCAPNFGLSCANSSCTCSSPDMIGRLNPDKSIDGIRRTECVLRAGSKCGLPFPFKFSGDSSGTRTLSTTYIWNKLRKNLPFLTDSSSINSLPFDFFDSDSNCVDNAHCIGGVCRCSPEHFKDFRGLCLRKRSIFQPCDDTDECRSSEGLQCVDGHCQCSKAMVFDRVKRKCFVPVGGECDAYSYSKDMECVRNADCSNERCVCLDGFKMSSDGTCGVGHGGFCDMQVNVCSDIQFTCRSGRCQCRYPVHQVYNETLGQCLSKQDGPCLPSTLLSVGNENVSLSFQQNCIPNAECVKLLSQDESNMFDFICKCVGGYAEDSSGNCVPSYSTKCIDDEDCDQTIGQLTCVNGRCACPDEMLAWDETRRKCVGVIGSRCKHIQIERILSFRSDVPSECVENGVCVEHVPRLDGRCECQPGFGFSKAHRKCVLI